MDKSQKNNLYIYYKIFEFILQKLSKLLHCDQKHIKNPYTNHSPAWYMIDYSLLKNMIISMKINQILDTLYITSTR